MSIIIQQQLEAALRWLNKALEDADTALALPPRVESLPNLGMASEKLARAINSAQSQLDRWVAFLAPLKGDQKTDETNQFLGFLVNERAPSDLLVDAAQVLADLDGYIDRTRALLPKPDPAGATAGVVPSIRLPTLQLPHFDGTEAKWPGFWSAFRTSVHENPALLPAQKFAYLVGCLKPEARPLVDGYALTDANYTRVIDMLQQRFGDDERRKGQLQSELVGLARPSNHAGSLRAFHEQIERICRQLEALGVNIDGNDFLTVAIRDKLPSEARMQLFEKEMASAARWTPGEWRAQLGQYVRLKEAVSATYTDDPVKRSVSSSGHGQAANVKKGFKTEIKRERAFPAVDNSDARAGNAPSVCFLCDKEKHKPYHCPVYPTPAARKERLIALKRCLACGKSGHFARDCDGKGRCRCGGRHHYLICDKPNSPAGGGPSSGANKQPLGKWKKFGKNSAVSAPANKIEENLEVQGGHELSALACEEVVAPTSGKTRPSAYLMVGRVEVYNHANPGKNILVSAFFDSGSQPSFISAKLASVIGPQQICKEKMHVGGFMGQPSQFNSSRFRVLLKRRDGGWQPLELNETPRIVPPLGFLVENDDPEDEFAQLSGEPEILIGIRHFWKAFEGCTQIHPGLYRINTMFGSILTGEWPNSAGNGDSRQLAYSCPVVSSSAKITKDQNALVKQLWDLESIGVHPIELGAEADAVDAFGKSIVFADGRYHVQWPMRPGAPELPTNFALAFSRLMSLHKRLKMDEKLREGYTQIIKEQLDQNIIEKADQIGQGEYFLPHHAVTGKKLRVVYDASAHQQGCLSLNQVLLPGPNLAPHLAAILLRFRCSPVPVLADIQKAFLQIGLKNESRELAKFLWLKNPLLPPSKENLEILRFKRVAFGVTSSPFILNSTLRYHLTKEGCPDLINNFYVDNLLLDCTSVGDAIQAIQRAKAVVQSAGMKLQEFVAADVRALEGLSPDELLPGEEPKVLGIPWGLKEDVLILSTPKHEGPCNRRTVLSTIAQLFDPLGLTAPLIYRLKLYFQSLWDTKKNWDEGLDPSDQAIWVGLMTNFEGQQIRIPRPTHSEGALHLALVAFTDASPDGYSCAIYMRASFKNSVKVSLVFAKSRLRPLKMDRANELTIPKLELLGILMGIKSLDFVETALGRQIDERHLFSDSQIALSWLYSGKTLPIFVANRVREIRNAPPTIFHHVRRADNPADLAVRGCSPQELSQAKIWWEGPTWLTGGIDEWPPAFRPSGELPLVAEPTAPLFSMPAAEPTVEDEDATFFLNPANFSRWKPLLKVAKFSLWFLAQKLRRSASFNRRLPWIAELAGMEPFGPETEAAAMNFLLKMAQFYFDENELRHIGRVQADYQGILCLRTRIGNADRPNAFKFPVILPRAHAITRLLILDAHEDLAHTGVEGTLNSFLGQFYCRRPRRLVKSLLHDCLVCRRDKAAPYMLPRFPPLPEARVRPSRPFQHVGLDYLGPTVYLDDAPSRELPKVRVNVYDRERRKIWANLPKRERRKVWIVIFTCFATRAIHVEAVGSLESIDFLMAFRRFVARRGLPQSVLSDNAAQLVLSRQVLSQFSEVVWKHTPPLAPWHGAIYERLNTLIKSAMRRALGRRVLPRAQFFTFLTEVEAMVNNRPISYVSEEMDGFTALRPVDFLLPKANINLLGPEEEQPAFRPNPVEKLTTLWVATNRALMAFWDRWSQEYLLMLRGRLNDQHGHPRSVAVTNPSIGQVVLLENDNMARNLWPLGKIVNIDHGRRSAEIFLSNGHSLWRPINKLAPLEAMLEEPAVSPEVHPPEAAPSPDAAEMEPPEAQPLEIAPASGALAPPELRQPEPALAQNVEAPSSEQPAAQPTRWALRRHIRPPAHRAIHWTGRNPMLAADPDEARPVRNRTRPMPLLSSFALWPSCLLLLCFLAPCLGRELDCVDEGVKVNLGPHASDVSTCCGGVCNSRPYQGPFSFPLPADLLAIGYECQVKYVMKGNRFDYQIECAPKDGCALLNCIFCLERVLNPQCNPLLMAIATGFFLGLSAVILFILFGFLYTLYFKCRTGHWPRLALPWRQRVPPHIPRVRFFRHPTLAMQREAPQLAVEEGGGVIIEELNEEGPRPPSRQGRAQSVAIEEDEEDIVFSRPTSPARHGMTLRSRTRVGTAMGLPFICILAFLAGLVKGENLMALTAKTEHCTASVNGTTCSFNAVTALNLLPSMRPVSLLLRGPHGIEMGTLHFVMKDLELVCQKVDYGLTRSVRFAIDSVKSCPRSGSCYGDYCARVPVDGDVPELWQIPTCPD